MNRVPSVPVLAERLYDAVEGARDPLRVALTSLGVAMLTVGLGPVAQLGMMLTARNNERVEAMRQIWETACEEVPYLREHLNPLIDWIDNPGPGDDEALARCFQVLADIHIEDTLEAADGEFLGGVYQWLLSDEARERVGAFYTPPRICFMIAHTQNMQHGDTLGDPACGAGTMAVAAVREFKARGGRAETLGFVLNDPDPIAVALAGINMAAYGQQMVKLSCAESWEPPDDSREISAGRRRRRAS